MATIDRRTAAELLTEHIARVGKTNASGTTYSDRANEFLSVSLRLIGATWHHPELDVTDNTLAFTASNPSLSFAALTAKPLVIMQVDLMSGAAGTFIKSLTYDNFHSIRARQSDGTAEPERYSRYANTLVADRNPKTTYGVSIDYYAKTTNIDTTAVLQLGEEWDEAILSYSVFLAHRALRNYELASQEITAFSAIVKGLPNPMLTQNPVYGEPVRSSQEVPTLMGAQG